MDDLNKERIRFNIEIIKLLTLLFIATGGGAVAIIAEGLDSVFEIILASMGTAFAVVMGVLGIRTYWNTRKKLK